MHKICLIGCFMVCAVALNPAQAKDKVPAAKTVFIDVVFGMRKDSAARRLSKSHAEFAEDGYRLLSIESFTENGDLQGFFVTYVPDRPGAD